MRNRVVARKVLAQKQIKLECYKLVALGCLITTFIGSFGLVLFSLIGV